MAQLTWLGHAAFRLESSGGSRLYVDPFLTGNPKCPPHEADPERVDLIALTHGHDDHVGDTVALAQRFGCPVVAQVELRGYLSTRGLPENTAEAMNKGGTETFGDFSIAFTDANHSSSTFADGAFLYLGEPCGLVVGVDGGPTVYLAGDTNVFMDMQLIARIYEPDLVVLPIGDHFTMGPREAAVALELLGAKRCLPCHWGTFPVLRGTPEALQRLVPDVEVLTVEPGETIEL